MTDVEVVGVESIIGGFFVRMSETGHHLGIWCFDQRRVENLLRT